jgi:hypothetical protein
LRLPQQREDTNIMRIRAQASRGIGQAIAMAALWQTWYASRHLSVAVHHSRHHNKSYLNQLSFIHIVVFFLSARQPV